MSRESEKRLKEWAVWFEEHKRDGGDLYKQIAFLRRAVEILAEVTCRCLEDIRELEGRRAAGEELGSRLYVPRGLNVAGDVRRLG
ncbi:MAG: hypothetical protein ACE5JI_21420 [Acidobacteriota bacterium]